MVIFIGEDNNFKEVCGETSESKKSKVIFVLNQQKEEINSEEDFKNNPYFQEAMREEGNEMRKYLRMIIKGIEEQEAKEKREREAELNRREAIRGINELRVHFFINKSLNEVLGSNWENSFTSLEGKKIEDLKGQLISKIRTEETIQRFH